MDKGEIETGIRRLIIEARGRSVSATDGESTEVPSDDIDSLEGVEAILGIEERFGVVIGDDELGQVCRSISRIAEAIARELALQEEERTTAS